MKHAKTISLWLLAIFMIGAGVMHFVRPEFYLKILPPYLPWHRELVYLSGVAESGISSERIFPARPNSHTCNLKAR